MSNLVDKAIELQVMTCLDSLLDRANHDEYLQRIGKKEALSFLEENSKYADIIKNALHRLEAIGNANPSEALEHFINYCENHTTGYTNDTDREDMEYVQQALLKAQEPKQYLKWEDLEFDRKEKIIKVKLGDNVYYLIVGLTTGGNNLVTFHTELKHHYFTDTDKQLFNDLHLERVEE